MYMPAQIQLKRVKTVEIEPESDVPDHLSANRPAAPSRRRGCRGRSLEPGIRGLGRRRVHGAAVQVAAAARRESCAGATRRRQGGRHDRGRQSGQRSQWTGRPLQLRNCGGAKIVGCTVVSLQSRRSHLVSPPPTHPHPPRHPCIPAGGVKVVFPTHTPWRRGKIYTVEL